MKRDWDIVRQVLSQIESGDREELRYSDSDDPVATGHAFLLRDAGCISAIEPGNLQERELMDLELTWEGHDLLTLKN